MPARLYSFESDLAFMPLCARRALDIAGIHLSLEAWRALDVDAQTRLCELGSVDVPVASEIRSALDGLEYVETSQTWLAVLSEPSPALQASLEAPIEEKVWQTLSQVDRYALEKSLRKPDKLRALVVETIGATAHSTHLDAQGSVRMVGVTTKPVIARSARARAEVLMNEKAREHLNAQSNAKGNVFATAKIAGIQAAKRTHELIPLCHSLHLTKIAVDIGTTENGVWIETLCEATERTGVEMEAMTAASIAALTIYDMCKAHDPHMTVGPVRLVEKHKGEPK